MIEVNDETFDEEVKKSVLPVVIDFWADWCVPCRTMGPVFDEISKQFEGKAKFLKIDVDKTDLAAVFHIRSIPTFAVVVNGITRDVLVGSQPKQRITEWIERNIKT